MIHSIQGSLTELDESAAVIEDRSGVSWEMEISSRTRADLAEMSESGTQVRLYAHLYHREDQMSLFGFARREEKRFFLLLNKVNGIGPRQSIKLLSSAGPERLARAIVDEDESFLTSLPGVGIKGAKKIILSLKDQVTDFAGSSADLSDAGLADNAGAPGLNHILEALIQMGFDRRESQRVLRDLAKDKAVMSSEEGEILRRAIIALS
jgi:Holliday junction DNA helicase RuvA